MFFTKSKSEFAKERRRRNQSKKTKKGKAMEALRLWSLTTSQPLRHLFHLTTSTTTTTNSSARLVLRCSSATTSTTEDHNHLSSFSSCSSSSSSSTLDRDVIHTIHLKKVLGFLFDFPIMAIVHGIISIHLCLFLFLFLFQLFQFIQYIKSCFMSPLSNVCKCLHILFYCTSYPLFTLVAQVLIFANMLMQALLNKILYIAYLFIYCKLQTKPNGNLF